MNEAQRRIITDLMTAAGFRLVEVDGLSVWGKALPSGETCAVWARGCQAFADPGAAVWVTVTLRREHRSIATRDALPVPCSLFDALDAAHARLGSVH
jgi:hypothetical protein